MNNDQQPHAQTYHQQQKLQQMIELAQMQIDAIATGTEPPVQPANVFIEIRNLAQEMQQ